MGPAAVQPCPPGIPPHGTALKVLPSAPPPCAALTAPAAVKDLRDLIDSLDVSGPATDRSRATLSTIRDALLAQPDDDGADDEDALDGETPIAADGWTKVWRDKRL